MVLEHEEKKRVAERERGEKGKQGAGGVKAR